MLDWKDCAAVERVPGKVGGAWIFKGTRVPVKALFENLEGGARIDEFLEWFPGVTREHVESVLSHAERSLIDEVMFDQGTPMPLRRELPPHVVRTARRGGLSWRMARCWRRRRRLSTV
jgi:uncharacterized protein (DUF433 family)